MSFPSAPIRTSLRHFSASFRLLQCVARNGRLQGKWNRNQETVVPLNGKSHMAPKTYFDSGPLISSFFCRRYRAKSDLLGRDGNE